MSTKLCIFYINSSPPNAAYMRRWALHQHCVGHWLGANWHQANAWANVWLRFMLLFDVTRRQRVIDLRIRHKMSIMLSTTNVLIFTEYLQYKPYFALAHFLCFSAHHPIFCFISTDIGSHKPKLLVSFVMNKVTALLGLNNALWSYSSCHTLICVKMCIAWWRHQMETFSALLAICAGNSPVPGEFPTQRPVTRSFDVYFDLRLNKRLSKQSWGWWFETPLRSLWRHRNGLYQIGDVCTWILIYFSFKSLPVHHLW